MYDFFVYSILLRIGERERESEKNTSRESTTLLLFSIEVFRYWFTRIASIHTITFFIERSFNTFLIWSSGMLVFHILLPDIIVPGMLYFSDK